MHVTKRILKEDGNLTCGKMEMKILFALMSLIAGVACTQKFQLKRTDANIWTVKNVNGRSVYNLKQQSAVTSSRPKTKQEQNFVDCLRDARFDSYRVSGEFRHCSI